MEIMTYFGGKAYKHSEYTTTLQLSRLPKTVKEAILKGRENNPIIEEIIE